MKCGVWRNQVVLGAKNMGGLWRILNKIFELDDVEANEWIDLQWLVFRIIMQWFMIVPQVLNFVESHEPHSNLMVQSDAIKAANF